MILNKLWSVAKKLSHSGDENDKPLVGEKMLVVDTSDRKKRSRHLHFFVGFGIATIFAIFLLLLTTLISAVFGYPVCLTCFPSLAEKISKKLTHNTHIDSKYDYTMRNSKTFSEKASNTSVLETAGKVTSTETPILINLNEQSVIIRGKNTVPEKIWILEDTHIYNVSETELPQKISVNERKHDSKLNITKDMHQINRNVPYTVIKLSSLYNDSSKSNFLLKNKLKKFPLKVPTVKNVSAIKSKHKSVTSVPDPWTSNDRILMFFPKTKFGKDTVEKRKKTNMHSGLESTPQINPVYKNKSESLTNNGGNVSENRSIPYYSIESSAAGKVSAIKTEFEGDPSVQDQWTSNEMIFPSFSETTIVEYQLGETEKADMHSGLNLTHWKNRAFKNESENPFNIGRIVGENLSRSYHPIKTSDVEKVPTIKKEFEDDPPVQDQWTTNDIIFLTLSETTFDKHLEEEAEKTDMSDTHSGHELIHRINRAIENEYIPNIDNSVEELLSISDYPIETSAFENISAIKDKNEDDTSVLGRLISNDIMFLPLSETTFDEHVQEEETKKTDMHRVNEVLTSESENPFNIDRSVDENPSVLDYPIESSAVENISAIKDKNEDDTSILGQLLSNDIIFLPLSETTFDEHVQEEETKKTDMHRVNEVLTNESENPFNIDRSVDENPSVSDYPIESSAVENISAIKDKNEDDTSVLGQWISNDIMFLPLSETTFDEHVQEEETKKTDMHRVNEVLTSESENPFNIDRSVDENPSVLDYPIESSAVENISAIKDKNEDDTSILGQLLSNDIIFLPLSETTFDEHVQEEETKKTDMHRVNEVLTNESENPFNIDRSVDENPSVSDYPIESSAVENISAIKDKNEDDTSVLGQWISNDIIFLPLSETTFDEHVQEEETKNTDMHRVSEVLTNESENPFNIDRSVDENHSVSDYPIESSAVENVLETKSEFQGHPSLVDQWTSNDMIFQFLLQPQFAKHLTEEKAKTKLDSGLELTSGINTALKNETENVPRIDGSVGENLSISYYLTETSDDESTSVLKNEDEDFPYVLDPWTSNDKLILGLSETTISKHLIEEKEKNNIHSSLNLSQRKSPAFQNKINISPKLFFSVNENLRIFQYPLKTEMKDNIIHINTKDDIQNMKNNIQKLSSSISTLQIDSVDVQDLNKLLETDDCFLDHSFSEKGISSNFLRSLFPILESDKFDTQHAEIENELAKLANENENTLLPNPEKISVSLEEFSVDVHTEDPFLVERQETNFNTLAISTEDIFHYNPQFSDFETQ